MFGWEYPPRFTGGLGIACQGLVHGLLQLGTRVILVLPNGAREPRRKGLVVHDAAALFGRLAAASPEEFRYIMVNSPLSPYLSLESYVELRPFFSAGQSPRLSLSGGYGPDLLGEVFRFARIGQRIGEHESFDVIHAHDWMTYPAGLAVREATGRPLVVHVHATEFDRTGGPGNASVAAIEGEGVRRADRVICVSHFTACIVRDRYGVPESRIRVVYNAIDDGPEPDEPETEDEGEEHEPVVLFVGRITFQKGPDYFVEAARLVLERRPDVRFVLAGAGDMLPPLLNRVAELGLGQQILFTGFLAEPELDRLYRRADVYVLPSVSEPFGLTVLEALQRGVPVILSKNAGVGEIVRHALRVDFWDARELASKILSVLDYPALQEELSAHGQAEVRRLSWKQSARQCLRVYREVVPR